MRVGQVYGNMVTVIHDPAHDGKKFLLVRFYDNDGNVYEEGVYADSATNAGVGDMVLVCEDGDAAEMLLDLNGGPCVFDGCIVGVVD